MGRLIDRFVPLRFRAAALMPAAVLTVHQLRFQLAFGDRADGRLAAEGHGYLTALAPLAAMLVAVAAGLFLAGLARAWRSGEGEGRPVAGAMRSARRSTPRLPSTLGLWLLAALALLAIYSAQELAEGFLASGHPGGLVGVFGEGGLWALPLALLLGAAVALALRFGAAAIAWAAARGVARPPLTARPSRAPRPLDALLAPAAPLAALAAGRAPPASALRTP